MVHWANVWIENQSLKLLRDYFNHKHLFSGKGPSKDPIPFNPHMIILMNCNYISPADQQPARISQIMLKSSIGGFWSMLSL